MHAMAKNHAHASECDAHRVQLQLLLMNMPWRANEYQRTIGYIISYRGKEMPTSKEALLLQRTSALTQGFKWGEEVFLYESQWNISPIHLLQQCVQHNGKT